MVVLCAAMLGSGCKTTSEQVITNPDGTTTTNIVNQVDPQTLANAAIILRSTARSAAVLGIQESPDAKKYIQLAVVTLDQFIVGTDYTPGALLEALQPVLKEVREPLVALAINTSLDLYEVFWGRYVKNKIRANENAHLFLTSLRDGAKSALEISANTLSQPTQ